MQHHLDVLRHSAQALGLNATLDASRLEKEKERSAFFSKLKYYSCITNPPAVIVRERKSFLNWISNIPFEKIHEDIYAKKHPDTGDWLIQTDQFQNWFNSPNSALLWCHGNREH
jgi:ankyrin repeat domain-containing protein 50